MGFPHTPILTVIANFATLSTTSLTLYKYSRFYLARSAWMSFFRASTPRRTAELVSSVIF